MSLILPRDEPDLAASPVRAVKVFERAGFQVLPFLGGAHWIRHGPAGFKFQLLDRDEYPTDHLGSVIVSQADQDGDEWVHASIVWTDRMPRYGDLATLKEAVFGFRRTAYQVFASSEQHVNIHEYALHLWGRADGSPVLPDFGKWGTI